MAEQYRSQIREKVKARKKPNRIKAPKGAKKELLQSMREKFKQSAVDRVKEAISKKAKTVGTGLSKGLSEGLSGIKHPAQLIPAIRKGSFFTDMIRSRIKKSK